LQGEIEQWQQHGDEKSLSNGTIFMKSYLVEIRLSGVAKQGYTMFYGKSQLKGEC